MAAWAKANGVTDDSIVSFFSFFFFFTLLLLFTINAATYALAGSRPMDGGAGRDWW